MMLVDKNIKELSHQGLLIESGYDEKNVNSISYDLTLEEIIGSKQDDFELEPGAVAMIKTKEKLNIPCNITGRIGEKNSLIRLGLQVSGPQYQPGHVTYAFLRVINLTENIITLRKNMKIAQIYFEELRDTPDVTYNNQPDASFNNEIEYRAYGKYESVYKKDIKSFQKVKNDIENAANRIYGNVLTLMGIIVAIFSMLSINYQAVLSIIS